MPDPGSQYCKNLKMMRDMACRTSTALQNSAEDGQDVAGNLDKGIAAAAKLLNDPDGKYYLSDEVAAGWTAPNDSGVESSVLAGNLCTELTALYAIECGGVGSSAAAGNETDDAIKKIWLGQRRLETLAERLH